MIESIIYDNLFSDGNYVLSSRWFCHNGILVAEPGDAGEEACDTEGSPEPGTPVPAAAARAAGLSVHQAAVCLRVFSVHHLVHQLFQVLLVLIILPVFFHLRIR